MNKKLVLISVIVLLWLGINFLGEESYFKISAEDLLVPFLWSCIFIYLYEKNYLYIAINSYIIFLLMLFADNLYFNQASASIQISYLLLSVSSVFVCILLYQELFSNKLRIASALSFIITIILYIAPLFYIIYLINFGTYLSREAIYSILQTNFNEATEFLGINVSPLWILVVPVLFVFVGFLFLKQEKKETIRIERSLLIFLVIMFPTSSYLNKGNVRLYAFAKQTVEEYFEEITLFNQTQEKLKTDNIKFEAEKAEAGETYIVVIGESLNKKHMGLYGYMRDTTPMLTKLFKNGNLLVFDNAFSCNTYTIEVLSLSLTEANQLNKKNFYNSLSIINILKKANIETYWVTNQVLYGPWDNLVSVIAHQADHLIALNHSIGMRTSTQEYDGAVIKEVNKILSKDSKNTRVIFVHLMGNHFDYRYRYPNKFRVFTGKRTSAEFGKLSKKTKIENDINNYDNSVLYNDYVVSSLIDLLKRKDGVNGFLYFSDHADDVENKLGHNAELHFTYINYVVFSAI